MDEVSADEFIQYCTQWKDQRITDISDQLKQLFVSLDWGGYVFYTMDEVRMFKLILLLINLINV